MFPVLRVKDCVVNYHVREGIAEMRWVDTWCLGHRREGGRAKMYKGGLWWGSLFWGLGFPSCAASWGLHGGDVTSRGVDVRAVVRRWWNLTSRMSDLADSERWVS